MYRYAHHVAQIIIVVVTGVAPESLRGGRNLNLNICSKTRSKIGGCLVLDNPSARTHPRSAGPGAAEPRIFSCVRF